MALPARRAYAGAAPACTLSSDISNSATSFSITGTTTNWPTTATGPFYMVIDPGLSTEEKVLVGARTTGSLSSVTRGVDGTTASAHVAGATCYPVFTAVDANEANLLASTMTTKGDLISTDGSDPKRVAVGSNNTRLVADSAQTAGIKWVADTQNTVIDAKGDLLVGSAADTVARLAVSTTNGAVLVADSTATNGVSWQAQNVASRNLLYNGAMQIAQRATSIASITATGYYTADRWNTAVLTLGTWTNSVESDAPTGSGFRNSLKWLCTTADASPAAGDYLIIVQKLEGQDLQSIRKGTSSAEQLTVSFWVKSNVTGTYVVTLWDSDNSRSVSKTFSVSASATWEQKTITFPADTTGAFNNDNGNSMEFWIWLAAGTNWTSGTRNETWASYTAANAANGLNVNLGSSINNYFQLTGVQLNLGGYAAPFEFKSYGQELVGCQRYYRKYGSTLQSGTYGAFGSGWVTGASNNAIFFPWGTTFRTPPSVTFSAANTFYVDRANGNGEATAIVTNAVTDTSVRIVVTSNTATGTTGQGVLLLQDSTDTAFIEASAEL